MTTNAAESYHKAIEIDPNDGPSYTGLGAVLYDKGGREPPRSPPPQPLAHYLALLRPGIGAAKNYRKAIELDATDAVPRWNLGNVLYDQGDRSGAAAWYRKAISLNPNYAPAYSKLGEVLHDQGDSAGAAENYRKAVALQPNDASYCNGLGFALLDQGDLGPAAEQLRQGRRTRPQVRHAPLQPR